MASGNHMVRRHLNLDIDIINRSSNASSENNPNDDSGPTNALMALQSMKEVEKNRASDDDAADVSVTHNALNKGVAKDYMLISPDKRVNMLGNPAQDENVIEVTEEAEIPETFRSN